MSIQKHGCYSANSYDPITWDSHTSKDKEAGPTGAWLVLRRVDLHRHQPNLFYQCRHHMQVHCWYGHIEDNDVHAFRRIGQRNPSIIPRCYGGKVQVWDRCYSRTHEYYQGLPILASICCCWSPLGCWPVGLLWFSMSEWCLFWLVEAIVHMGTCVL